jgi:hypothetical protein
MILFAYFGPETQLPLASAAAAVVGFVLMTGRMLSSRVAQWFRGTDRGR